MFSGCDGGSSWSCWGEDKIILVLSLLKMPNTQNFCIVLLQNTTFNLDFFCATENCIFCATALPFQNAFRILTKHSPREAYRLSSKESKLAANRSVNSSTSLCAHPSCTQVLGGRFPRNMQSIAASLVMESAGCWPLTKMCRHWFAQWEGQFVLVSTIFCFKPWSSCSNVILGS